MSKSEKSNIRTVLRLLGPSDIEEHSDERDYLAPQKLAVGAESFEDIDLIDERAVESQAAPITFRDFLKQEEQPVHSHTFKKVDKKRKESFYFEHLDILRSSTFKIMLVDAFKLYMKEANKEFHRPEADLTLEGRAKGSKKALVYSSQGILINKKF